MYRRIMFCVFMLIGLTVNAQTINIRGKVTNQAGQPVSNAIVELLRQGLKDTTGSDGLYSIKGEIVAVLPPLVPRTEKISMNRGVLEIILNNPSPVKVEIFDVKGKLLGKEMLPNAPAGVYRLDIAENSRTAKLLVIHASIGRRSMTFRCLPQNNGKYAVNPSIESITPFGGRLTKAAAPVDSLRTTAEGYTTKVMTITSYDQELNITLDASGGTVCEGCGKTPPASGARTTIDVDGTKREYLLKLPANYDPNKSYKLIFCPHWMGGKIEDVVGGGSCGGPYYGLEKLANNTAIFAVPQGLGSTSGFPNTNGQDVKFFKAMLKQFNSTLCIDQKRVFSTGFSYGGCMSFALGCAMADVFRAIAPMSGAFYSGCDKVNDLPIAVWQAHGKSDNVVPLKDAQRALNYFLEKNGCGTQTTPVNPSPCVAYQGCKEGYPVVYCEFNGGHGVQSFAAAAVWEFFNQF